MSALPVALAMHPGLEGALFPGALRERLERVGRLVLPAPLRDPGGEPLERKVAQSLGEAEVLLTGWGCERIEGPALERMPRLRLVAHAAGTVKGIVSDALFERGIRVTSAAAANAVPVAEFTFAALVFAGKDVFRLRDLHRETRGRPLGHGPRGPLGNRGLRIGIVGASRIGRLVIERLRTLEVEVAVYDPFLHLDDAESLGVQACELVELLARSDVVSLHAPLLPTTRHMIGARELAAMRDGAWLVNTARGALVDGAALEAELVSGRLRAFLDVTEPEPLPPESPLYDLPNVVLTPHVAGSLGNELPRMGELVLGELERFAAGEPLLHPVRREELERIA